MIVNVFPLWHITTCIIRWFAQKWTYRIHRRGYVPMEIHIHPFILFLSGVGRVYCHQWIVLRMPLACCISLNLEVKHWEKGTGICRFWHMNPDSTMVFCSFPNYLECCHKCYFTKMQKIKWCGRDKLALLSFSNDLTVLFEVSISSTKLILFLESVTPLCITGYLWLQWTLSEHCWCNCSFSQPNGTSYKHSLM